MADDNPSWPPGEIRRDHLWLKRVALALVHGDEADDVVQETWLARVRLGGGTAGATRGWLRVVLTNAWRKHRRARTRRRHREHVVTGDAADASAPDAETLALRLEALRRVGELTLALDEPLRTALLLRYYEGLLPAQIAARLGVPAGTVRWRLKQGRERLRAAFEKEHATGACWRSLLAPLSERHRAVRGKEILVMKAATKTTAVVIGIVLALAAGVRLARRQLQRQPVPAAATASIEAPVAPQSRMPDSVRPTRSAGVPRVHVPRFTAGPAPMVPVAAASPSADPPTPKLARGGGGLKDRRPHPGPNAAAELARAHAILDRMDERARPCVARWRSIDPLLSQGVMLRISLDADGLQDVSIDGQPFVPEGPLRCFSEAVYALDWSGLTREPVQATVRLRYETPDGG